MTLDACVEWFARNSTWAPSVVAETLTAAIAQGRGDLRRVATVLRELAGDRFGRTESPRRLLADGPWWAAAAPGGPGVRDRRAVPRCPVKAHDRQPADRCLLCAGERLGVSDDPEPERGAEPRAVRAGSGGRKFRFPVGVLAAVG